MTDSKKMKENFLNSEKLFDDILDGSPIPQFLIGRDHRIIKWNKALEEYSGVKAEDIIGTDNQWAPFYLEKRPVMADLLIDGAVDKIPQLYAGKYAKSRLVEGAYEGTDFFSKLGKNGKWLYFTASTIKDSEDNIVGAVETLEDVTERKLAENALYRSNRELRAISDCNQALMRADDEQTMLNEICRIICEEAGYFLAWVGYAENDEYGTVRPMAWAGVKDENLVNARITWSDTERGQGPIGSAVRTGKTSCVQDFATDTEVMIWRENALKRGHRSGISLPLKDEYSNTFGVLNIYSAEPNAFTSEEVRLMEELAGNLAFGINVLRARVERKQAERALEESEAKMRSILDNIGIGVALISPGMEILELNHRMRKWFADVDPAQYPICYRAFNDPPRDIMCDYCPTCKTLEDGLVHEATTETPQKGGVRKYRIVSSPLFNESGKVTAAVEIVEDITDKLTLESQFRQAQKMESIGRLAGGVAHDFNNMLSVIIGYTELAIRQVGPNQPFLANLEQIRKAAQRSADLTRQLLAFARKQAISPKILDLNETVESMLKILRRLIGEDIDLAWLPGKNLWQVNMDPSQIDQILANLCVNARDAITGVGKVTIETGTVSIDEAFCAGHMDCVPGEYVLLTVSDNGCGMGREILDKLFEPFFTTKESGKGTGLGLATVYGIVKQNNGFINVYSEQGHGTAFKIYLPRHETATGESRKEITIEPARGNETILLVEDEPSILDMAMTMLRQLGYTVLATSTPGEAIRLAEVHQAEIHMLISDVVMPGMTGRDMAKSLLRYRPHIKHLFMSGYTADVIANQGVLDEGINFIQKPFSVHALAAKVREVLDGK